MAAPAELQIDLDLSLMLFYGAHPSPALPRALGERGSLLDSPLQSPVSHISQQTFFRQGHKVLCVGVVKKANLTVIVFKYI